MKKNFIIIPLIIFLFLVTFAYYTNNIFLQNLFFCISSSLLGIIATFLVIDTYYKKKDEIDNKSLLLRLARNFLTLTHSTFLTLLSSYKLDVNFENLDKNSFINVELQSNEIKKIVKQIHNFKINDYSKYINNNSSKDQIHVLKNDLEELKNLFLYLPNTLSIYQNCFSTLLEVISNFQYFEYRIINNNVMLDCDISVYFFDTLNTFNDKFIYEIKKINNKEINNILFKTIKTDKY